MTVRTFEGAIDNAPVLHIGREQTKRLLGRFAPGHRLPGGEGMGFADKKAVALNVERIGEQTIDRLVVEIGDASVD